MRCFSIFVGMCLLLFALPKPCAYGQVPGWQSAISTSRDPITVQAVATTASGDVYITGMYGGTTVFGSITMHTTTFDVFVAKWSGTSGDFAWVQQAGGSGVDRAYGIAVQGNSVYLTGAFGGNTATFGATVLNNANPSSSSTFNINDVFVAKLTDAGMSATWAWAIAAGGTTQYDTAYGLAVSGSSVYITGTYGGFAAAFGATTLLNFDTTGGGTDIFVAKLTDAGSTASFAWALRAGGTDSEEAKAIAVEGPNVYIAGSNYGIASFGSTILTRRGVFVAKFLDSGSSGSALWAQGAASNVLSYPVAATAVAVNGGNVYVAGNFSGPATVFGGTTLAAVGSYDVFVAKLSDAGSTSSFAWAQQAGGLGEDYVKAMVVEGRNVYVAGYSNSVTASFGATTFTNATISRPFTSYENDGFISRLTDAGSSGSFAWVRQVGGPYDDYVYGLDVHQGVATVAGTIVGPVSFDFLSLTNGGFAASLYDATALATASPMLQAGLSLYPNPARATATVRIPAVPGVAQAAVVLVDAMGRRVFAQPVSLPATGASLVLPLRGLAPGLYQVQVQAGSQRVARSLTVE